MSDLEKKSCGSDYWQDVENKVLDPKDLANEFGEKEFDSFSVTKSRRNFLKIMGFSVSALPLTGCIKIPVKKALPYLNQQENTIPGVANWYASTFNGTPVLVKTREGRPIKVEGNEKSLTTKGGAGSQDQASVLSLYDSYRLKSPMVGGRDVQWAAFDTALKSAIENGSGNVVLVTPSMTSPSELALIKEFSEKYNVSHVAYDSISRCSEAMANRITHGTHSLSEFNFEAADVVISFEADFLGTWGNGVAQTKQYTARRSAKHAKGMNRHIQVEARMSLTGSNADFRFTKSHADQRDILLAVHGAIVGGGHSASSSNSDIANHIIKELKAKRGKSLVVAGVNDMNAQVLVNDINNALGNYGSTVFTFDKKSGVQAIDKAMTNFITQMNADKIGTVLFVNVNPAYDYRDSKAFISALKKVPTSVSFALAADETSELCQYVAPMNHVYESWSDTFVSNSELSITQPVIQPLYGTRMWTDTLLTLLEKKVSFYDYMKSFWASQGWSWNKTLHDGVIAVSNGTEATFRTISSAIFSKALAATKSGSGMNVITFSKNGITNGAMGNNPWLHEMPNPITKGTWDNYAMISPVYAKEQGIKSGDVVEVTVGSHTIKVPAISQPGVEKNTIAVALGYGHSVGGKVSKNLGGNAFPFVTANGSQFSYSAFGSLKKTGVFRGLAQTQTHHSMESRDIIRETTFAEYIKKASSGNEKKAKLAHIYPPHRKDGHQWAMAINLSQCTGCSSCIISCNAENNVPVVGRKEVATRRELHWLRIDRYYKGDDNQPEVAHMPMLCQHCDNAPCENVCPVMATVQSSDGINQQVYNRCVGTRYCANNCPYKVRRFNWFNYERGTSVEKMQLNPDVSVRSRGVMEKCSLCIQRIQEGKLQAKLERRDLKDGDIKLACQQSCPGEGIIFGDMNDKTSKIAQHLEDERKYVVLEELNIQPRVNYLTKIRNK